MAYQIRVNGFPRTAPKSEADAIKEAAKAAKNYNHVEVWRTPDYKLIKRWKNGKEVS